VHTFKVMWAILLQLCPTFIHKYNNYNDTQIIKFTDAPIRHWPMIGQPIIGA